MASAPPPPSKASPAVQRNGPARATAPRAQRSDPACPRCGTPYDLRQEYCLECGLRLPAASGLVPALATAWRTRLRWYPGDWVWPALLFAAIAAVGAGLAILATRGDTERRTLVATSPPGQATETIAQAGTGATTAPGLAPQDTTVPTDTGQTATDPAATQPAARPPGPDRPIDWPADRSGYTVVLASVPATNGEAAARAQAEKALAAGLRRVGVLDSSQYSSLHPGYYVVFSGVHDSVSSTQSDLERARANGYPRAYPRQITP